MENRVILGGRFVISEGLAKQEKGGLDVASTLIFGYDGRTREHTVVVMDTFGTYYVTAAGAKSEAGDVVTMRGETPEGNGVKRFDVILRWVDDNTYTTPIAFKNSDGTTIVANHLARRIVQAQGTLPTIGVGNK